MNRRSFIESMLAAGVSAMILPSAGRTWTTLGSGLVVPNREGMFTLRYADNIHDYERWAKQLWEPPKPSGPWFGKTPDEVSRETGIPLKQLVMYRTR